MGSSRHLPHAQDDLEALVLSSGQDVLRSVALSTGVGTDESRQVLQGIEIGLIVTGRLAGTIGVLVAEGETKSTLGGNEGRRSGQKQGNKTGGTHCRECMELACEQKEGESKKGATWGFKKDCTSGKKAKQSPWKDPN